MWRDVQVNPADENSHTVELVGSLTSETTKIGFLSLISFFSTVQISNYDFLSFHSNGNLFHNTHSSDNYLVCRQSLWGLQSIRQLYGAHIEIWRYYLGPEIRHEISRRV